MDSTNDINDYSYEMSKYISEYEGTVEEAMKTEYFK
jgi:hypothetical protein